jgi:AraC-like DNA-binding protein
MMSISSGRKGVSAIARGLPDPEDYFAGAAGLFARPPREVLMFCRRRAFQDPVTIHHRFVLVIALESEGGIILERGLHPLAPGQGLLIFPYQGHHYARFASPDIQWLYITFEMDTPDPLEALHNVPFTCSERMWALLRPFCEAYQGFLEGDAIEENEVIPRLCLLLSGILRELPQRRFPEGLMHGSPLDPHNAFLHDVSRYILRHLSQPLTADILARQFSLSSTHLRRLFRETVGTSLGVFIRQARLQKASMRLLGTADSVTDIAEACGFNSVFAFSRAFQHNMGISPTQFRAENRPRRPPGAPHQTV